MDRFAEVKEAVDLEQYMAAHLQRKGRQYICPVCGSGTHKNGTPAMFIQGRSWKCFSCGHGGDVFDLAGVLEHTEDKNRQLEAVAAWAGIDVPSATGAGPEAVRGGHTGPQDRSEGAQKALGGPTAAEAAASLQGGPQGATGAIDAGRAAEAAKVEEWRSHIGEAASYLKARGWTVEDARAAGMGYDPARRRLILPWRACGWYHIDRETDGRESDCKYTKPPKKAVGEQPPLWNPAALQESVLFVVEGVLDALAVEACGCNVEALAGIGWHKLAAELKAARYAGAVVVMLDFDETGRRASGELCKELKEAGIAYVEAQAPEGEPWKDAGELFERDRAALTGYLVELGERAEQAAQDARDAEYSEALERLGTADSFGILQAMKSGADLDTPVKTGIHVLDVALGGGLHPGLIIVGAVSSSGKTTLLTQIADHIARSGRPVLFVTIEQSGRELVAKSLARMAYEDAARVTFTASDVLDAEARARPTWQPGGAAFEAFERAAEAYAEDVAPWLIYMEGRGRPTAADVASVARRMRDRCGRPPVLFVDYLQLIAPASDRLTDKQAVDTHVTDLRQLARELRTPVVAVSSLNRAGYYGGSIGLDDLKESGSLEYGADTVIGLQVRGINEAIKEAGGGKGSEQACRRAVEELVDQDKRADRGRRELVILKARGHRLPPRPVALDFIGAAGLFEPAEDDY